MSISTKTCALALITMMIVLLVSSCLKEKANNESQSGTGDDQSNAVQDNSQGGEAQMDETSTHYHKASEIMFLSENDSSCKDASYKLLSAFDKNIICFFLARVIATLNKFGICKKVKL